MKTAWCKLSPRPENVLEMPLGATILSVQVKDGDPYLLVLEDPDESKTERRYFWTSEAGKTVPNNGRYIGTFVLEEMTGGETWDDIMGSPKGPEYKINKRFFCVFEGKA